MKENKAIQNDALGDDAIIKIIDMHKWYGDFQGNVPG